MQLVERPTGPIDVAEMGVSSGQIDECRGSGMGGVDSELRHAGRFLESAERNQSTGPHTQGAG